MASLQPQTPLTPRTGYWRVAVPLFAFVLLVLVGGYLFTTRTRQLPVTTSSSAAPSQGGQASPAATAVTSLAADSPSAPTGADTPEAQIRSAYQKYLDVYSQAVLNLDGSHLAEILDGRALKLVTDEVNGLKSQGRPVKIVEDQRFIALTDVTMQSGTLVDEYTSRSVFIDAATHQPLPRTGPPTHVRQSYVFQNENGVWKIVDGTRQTVSPSAQP